MNETITQLTYENVTEITTNPVFIGMIIAIWFIPLIIYIIVGSFSLAKYTYIGMTHDYTEVKKYKSKIIDLRAH